MRDRRKTIASLRRLAERPGTHAEGETARLLLEKMAGNIPQPKPFNIDDFPRLSEVFYNYWCYENARGVVVGREPKTIQEQIWIRIKFDHLKAPRRVPVTSKKGCHLSKERLSQADSEYLQRLWTDD